MDWLFHFGLEFPRDKGLFENVKFICTGGPGSRITKFAEMVKDKLKIDEPLKNLAPEGRFVMFKVGPVLDLISNNLTDLFVRFTLKAIFTHKFV